MTDLSGPWRAMVSDNDLLRDFTDPDFDDASWVRLTVPGHWRSHHDLAGADGPVLHRRGFPTPPEPPADDWESDERRSWLVLDGVFYESDLWLDGTYLGDTEGYFFPHQFEVTSLLADRAEHVLAAAVACAPEHDLTAKRNLTGAFQHGPHLDPEWNPGGIWRPVRIDASGPVRIRHVRVLCTEADDQRAVVQVRTVLDTVEAVDVELRAVMGHYEAVEQRSLAAGENRVEWSLTIPEPERWWPHTMGDQPLHALDVEIRLTDGRVSDHRRRRIGLRSVRMNQWVLEVNGERLFVKGSNQGPTRMALAEASAAEIAGDVDLAIDANLDMLRVHAHVGRPELYDAADERGLLIWQDMPLQWGYNRGVRMQARRQARELVDLLGHHPSVAVWCGHNEPFTLDVRPETIADPGRYRRLVARGARQTLLPSWNKTVLDGSIRRVIEKNDPTRPVVAHSGVFPHPPQFDGTDTHLYLGWCGGDERFLPKLARYWPRVARFVTEFGAQAVPANADFCEPERWPDLDWDRLAHRHGLQKSRFDIYVPPADYTTFDEWRDATQRYQATLIRRHIEALRRIKYRPTGGFGQFCFADGHPGVTWSVLDHERSPKAGLSALRDACAPVIVVADRLPAHLHPGQTLSLDIHVVSDLHEALPEGEVRARLHWNGGDQTWRWGGRVEADECAYIGTVNATAPSDAGRLMLDLEYHYGDQRTTNRYEAPIIDH